jgi:hypothetical protein
MHKSVLSFAATAALCLLVSADASARSENLLKIPSTPASCGTCHIAPGGSGPRNPFGIAFDDNGRKWDQTLCEQDSDGDGVSNGAELGDPMCMWTVGAAQTTALSKPGDSTSKPPVVEMDMGMADMAIEEDMAVEMDMGTAQPDMAVEQDMGTAQPDMASEVDMGTSADMGAPGDGDGEEDDDGCAQAGLNGRSAGAPAFLLGLLGLVGLVRRRRS